VYSDSEDAQVSLAARNRDSGVRIIKGDTCFIKDPLMLKNAMVILELGGSESNQQYLEFRGDDFDADIHVEIFHEGVNQVPMTRETLKNLDLISQVTQQSIADIDIIVSTTENLGHYLELVKALSDKYKVTITVHKEIESGASVEWLSKTPQDSDVIVRTPPHLAETQPHNDKKLQDWDTPNQEQINKLKAESQKTKPQLANHDHQVLIQTEPDDNVKDSTLKLALKHPAQTTIVQMQKDGTYRVVYGTDLDKITGRVKLSVVGYGRKTQEGGDTLGGRSATELSANITKLNQALTGDADIRRISLVGCNIDSDNPTDNSESQYGRKMLEKLSQSNIKVPVVVRSNYVAVDEHGRKITSSTGAGDWIHKDSAAKTIYSLGATGAVISRVYNNEGTLIKYNGRNLGEDLDNDISSQDTSNQQEASDKQKPIDVEKTKQKLVDIDKQQTNFAKSVNQEKLKANTNNTSNTSNTSNTNNTNKKKFTPPAFNIQIDVGDGDHIAFFGGSTNVDVKVGNGAHYTLMYGDNNILVSVGHAGDTNRFIEIGGYRALEGVQILIGTKNVVVNYGVRNDFIIATDPSFPMIPFVNPFDGSANILGSLQDMADMSNAEQNILWSWKKTKKFAKDMSSLDTNSDTNYKKILNRGGQNKVSDRGLKYDIEATLNKKATTFMQRESIRQQANQSFKEKLSNFSLNLTIGGQGSDILIGNGNFSFMFGDTFSSVLDTTVASLFGIMQQGYTSDGQPKTTFTYTPSNVKTKLINGILNEMAAKAEDTTFGDILGYQYIDSGEFYKTKTSTPDLSMSDILKELLGTVSDTFDNSIQALSEPNRIINALKSSTESIEDMGENTLDALGLKDKKKDDDDDDDDDDSDSDSNDSKDSNNVASDNEENLDGTEEKDGAKEKDSTEESKKAFGFSGLKLPSLFDLYAPNLIKTLSNLPELAKTLSSSIATDSANMEDKVVEFFSGMGYMTNDGDLFFNIGAYNFAWGGDGKDLFALMGTNNNVWGGKGDDVAYVIGEGNTISGNEGDDNAVFVGQNHMFIGGEGDDIGVASGRYNTLFGGTGADQLWAFGERAYITGNEGDDYLVSTGNYGKIYGHSGDDIGVVIGAHNIMNLGEGDDHGKVFGNKNIVYLGEGNDELEVASHDSVISAGSGNDSLYMHKKSSNNNIDAGTGDDLLYLGGTNNSVTGGEGADVFIIGKDNLSSKLTVDSQDYIVFDLDSYQDVMYYRYNDNDLLIKHRFLAEADKSDIDSQADNADIDSQEDNTDVNVNVNVNVNTSKQYQNQDGTVLIKDYFADNNSTDGAKICVDIDAENNRYHYLDKAQVSKLVEYMSSFDSFADTEGAAGYTQEVNQLWSASKVGYNMPEVMKNLT
jgi:hypothetical protein